MTPRDVPPPARTTVKKLPIHRLSAVIARLPLSREARSRERGLGGEGAPSLKARRKLGALICVGALAAVALLLGQVWLWRDLSWSHREPPGNPEFGINYSCNQAEYLLLETPGGPGISKDRPGRVDWCVSILRRLLSATGARHVRISVEWDQVEPREGAYDFALIDGLLAAARADGVRVLLSVGVKGQRHPEYYIPPWLLERVDLADGADISAEPLLRERALAMVRAVVAHASASPAVDSWLADNEPYHGSPRAHMWYLGREFVQDEVAAIRAADPLQRPVAINHAERLVFDRRWQWPLEDADIVATSIYPFRNYELFGRPFVINILDIGPLMPNYAARARETRAAGKAFWITEMQAEPWADPDIRTVSPVNPARDMTPEHFRDNVDYARRSGASRVYLWGAEWWLMQADLFGDATWLERARQVIAAR